jgi:hypothetical protein
MCATGEIVHDSHQLRHCALDIEPLRPPPGGASKLLAPLRICSERMHAPGESVDVARL